MKTAFLHRGYQDDTVTLGMFSVLGESHPPLYTLEEPWKNNAPNVSCIPAGKYICRPHTGARFKGVWQVMDVPGRSAILIHAGNTTDDIEGCILVGLSHGRLNRKPAVLESRPAITWLRKCIGHKNAFELTII